MISYLKGLVVHAGEAPQGSGAYLVVEVNGIGYQVLTHARTVHALTRQDAAGEKLIYTSLLVREDAMQLVGFLSREERELFEILNTASGVGAKVALALMTDLSVAEIAGAILSTDYKRLTVAKGVGPKLAQKMTIELKDKLLKWHEGMSSASRISLDRQQAPLPALAAFDEAEAVLLTLGYSPEEIYRGLQHIQAQPGDASRLTSEEVLHQVLKFLATAPVR